MRIYNSVNNNNNTNTLKIFNDKKKYKSINNLKDVSIRAKASDKKDQKKKKQISKKNIQFLKGLGLKVKQHPNA